MNLKSPAKPVILILAISIQALLAACGGDGGRDTTPETAPLSRPLSEIKLPDPALQACLEEQALINNYQTVGGVEELRCDFIALLQLDAVSRFQNGASAEEILSTIVRDTTGINQFTQLRKLDLSQGLYTSIDIKPLKRLQHLDLSGSFIESLDLGEKPELQSLNVAATMIKMLDLSDLTHLEVLQVQSNNSGNFAFFDDFLAMLSEITVLNIDKYKSNEVGEVIFGPTTTLKTLTLPVKTVNNFEPSETIKELAGSFPTNILLNSPNLEIFEGEIQTSETVLDLRPLVNLQRLSFSSDTVSEIILPEVLELLSASAPLQMIDPANNTSLVALEVHSPLEELDFNQSVLVNERFTNSLQSLSIKNYFIGRFFDARNFTSLTSLTLDNSFVDIALYIPDQLEYLTLIGTIYLSVYSDANLQSFILSDVPAGVCSLEEINLPNTLSMSINNCDATDIDLATYNKLTSLHITNSKITSIDLSPLAATLNNLFLIGTQLSSLNLTPLEDKQRNNLDIRNNLFEGNYKEDLKLIAESIFRSVRL